MKKAYKFLFFSVLLIAISTNSASAEINTEKQNIIIKVGEKENEIGISDLLTWFSYEPDFRYDPSYQSEIENPNYCPVDIIYCELTLSSEKRNRFKKKTVVYFNSSETRKYLENLSENVNLEPIDAKLKMEDGRVTTFVKSRNGVSLDIDKSIEILKEEASKIANDEPVETINLSFNIAKPEVYEGDINNLGIKELIGIGESDFKGSTKSRIHNIKAAVSKFDGLLIGPGEEFSFVKNLGDVDAENGYLPELVIKSNVTEPEFGGGICQVSTTMFRAAIHSGLEITARKNHAYPVQYYNPQGMDATVYIPWPDLRFINNTPGHILIQSEIEDTELTFEFYGTDDERKTEIDGPHITQRNPDGSMKAYFIQKVIDNKGDIILNETFNSSYNSPNNYPHTGQETIHTKKPDGWSDNEWKKYKKANGL